MRKLLFLFAVLLTSVGAWAQPQTSDAPSDDQWAANTTWFVMSTLSGYLYGSEFADENGLLQLDHTITNTAGEHLLWSVVEGEAGKYYIYNKAKGTDVVLGFYDTTPSGDNRTYRAKFVSKDDPDYTTLFEIVRSQKSTANQDYWCLREPSTTKYWNRGKYLTYWDNSSATNDNGSAHMFVESDIVEGMEYEFTDNVGNSFTGTFTGMKSTTFVQPSYTGVNGATLGNLSCTENLFSATITFPFPVSNAENVNKVMISSFNSETRKWYAVSDKIKTVTNGNATRENIGVHMWVIYPLFADGNFTFKIKNYSTNTFIRHNGTSDKHTETALSLVSENEASVFTYEASNRLKVVGTDQYMSTESPDRMEEQYLGTHSSTGHNGSRLKIFNPYYNSDVTLKDVCGTIYSLPSHKINEAQGEPAFAGADGYTLTDKVWDGNAFTATINFPIPVSSAEITSQTIICPFSKDGTNKYFADGTAVRANRDNTMPFATNVSAVNYLWAFYPNITEGIIKFKIKNVGTGTYISSDVAANDHSGDEVVLVESTKANTNACLFTITSNKQIRNNKGYDLSVNTERSGSENIQTVGTYNSNHSGTKNKIICANNYTLTLSDGSKYVGTNGVQNLIGSGYTYTNGAWSDNGYSANIDFDFPFPVSSANQINPTMISSGTGDWTPDIRKWYATEGGVLDNGDAKRVSVIGTKKSQEPTDANRMTYMWAIYPTLKNNAFTYNVKNLATGTYVHSTSSTNSHAPGAVTLQSEGSELTYVIDNNRKQFKLSTNKYLSLNSSSATFVQYVGTWDYHGGCGLSLIQVEDVNFELHSFAVKSVVEGYESSNPNTHLGAISVINGIYGNPWNLSTSTISNVEKKDLYVDLTKGISLAHTRNYRGYKFLGFWLGETELGQTPTLTTEQVNAINEANPIIAKYEVIPGEVTLFYDDDAFSYRIPAIAKTSTGRLIAVSDYRHNLDDIGCDNHGTGTLRIDLVARTSDDNGATWSEKQTIAEGTGNKNANGYDCAYGDAAIAAVGEKVLVMAAAGNVVFTGGSPISHNRTVRLFSEDNGTTWTKEDISETLFIGDDATIKNGYSAFFGSGKLAVDTKFIGTPEKPRIYGAMLIRRSNGTSTSNYNNYAIYSDDFGRTWNILGSDDDAKQTPIASGDEPKIEILPNGQILLSVRRGGGRIFNVFTYGNSEEDKANGIGTWNGNVNGCDNGGVSCNGETFCVDAKKTDGTLTKLLLQSQPHGGDRNNVSIWYKEISAAADATHTSADIAGNWTLGLQVSTQKSAYSAMTLQEDGKIGFFFEEAPCYGDDHTKGYCMVYMPLSISEITNGKYADQNSEAKAVNVVLTDAQGNSYNQSLNIFADDEEAIKELVKTTCSFAEFGANPVLTKDGNTYTYTNTITLPFKVSNNEGTYWHNIYYPTAKGNNPIYWSANNEDDEYATKQKTDDVDYGASIYNTKANEKKIAWAIYSVNNSFTFKFKNKLTGKYVQVTSVAPNESSQQQNAKYVNVGDASIFEIVKDAGSRRGDYAIKSSVNSSDGYLCSTGASYDYLTHFNHSNHEGAWVKFVEAPDFDALIAEVNSVISVIGDGIGQYPAADQSKAEEVITAQAAMQSEDNVTLKNLNLYKTYGSYIEGAKLNLPKAGQFYRIKSCSNGKYLSNTVDTTIPKTIFTKDKEESDPSIIYYFEPGTGEGEYYLMSYANGHYLANPWRIGVGTEIIEKQEIYKQFTTITEGQRTKYVLKYANGSDNLITVSDAKTDYTTDKNLNDAQWTFEPVEILPFTFNPAGLGFATFNAPVAVELPEGVLAYVTQINLGNNTLQMHRLEDKVVPANTPVMLYCEAAKTEGATKELKIVSTYTGNEFNGFKNSFYGTIAAETYPTTGETVYSLRKSAGKNTVGFYEKADGNLGGFKAWIKTATSNARAFTIIFDGDDATGLKEALGLENENVEIYDLSGRRLDKPTKGVNVIGGKLVIK